ncbi:hypothetical protein R6Q59_006141 [Mikania micrantha]|uniref:Uncharacterized protein n=1 Tax=Mikania micrantha TaxID=192012 RepID=A0A5N6PVP9_9ASTR|nr:hypothetical protein E3N88_04541 [Mikania micrantha]
MIRTTISINQRFKPTISLEVWKKKKVAVLENLSNLKGNSTSLQDQLAAAKASNNETMKLKEALECEVKCLRLDIQVRDDRDHLLSRVQDLSAQVLKRKELIEKSVAELGNLEEKSNELEVLFVDLF